MKTITNPTTAQIKKALAFVKEESVAITNDRYAMTKYGTFINNGNVSTPKAAIKAIRYITVYSTIASVAYVLENISMYPAAAITNAGYTPVDRNQIPNYFDNIETIIYECD